MPVATSYPGVYIQEVASGVHTITGVATSIAAFVDFFTRGPMDTPVQVFDMAGFNRLFGGLNSQSEASYAIQQFFDNGGSSAWVVRTAKDATKASVDISSSIGGAVALTIKAISEGAWANGLRVDIDYPAPTSNDRFNLAVKLVETIRGVSTVTRSETFRDLSMTPADLRYVEKVVNDALSGSELVRVTASGTDRPMQTGTTSAMLNPPPALTANIPQMIVSIGTETGTAVFGSHPTSLDEARVALEASIRAARPELTAFSQSSVQIVDNCLRIKAGSAASACQITFSQIAADPAAATLQLLAGTAVQCLLSGDLSGIAPWGAPLTGDIKVSVGASTGTVTITAPANATDLATKLEAALRTINFTPASPASTALNLAFAAARVAVYTDAGATKLLITVGAPPLMMTFGNGAAVPALATTFKLESAMALSMAAFASGVVTSFPAGGLPATSKVGIQFQTSGGTVNASGTANISSVPSTAAAAAGALQAAIRLLPGTPFANVGVVPYVPAVGQVQYLVFPAAASTDLITFAASSVDATTVTELGLGTAASVNVQQYTLGSTATVAAQVGGAVGFDGFPPTATELIGDPAAKTGFYALEQVDLFNILCLPRTAIKTGANRFDENAAKAALGAALNYCERRRAFLIIDTPDNVNTPEKVRQWLDANSDFRRTNAALYFPRVLIPDPLDDFRLRSIGASGALAGIYARTDGTDGVWKAPAGTRANINSIAKPVYGMTDAECGVLNQVGINCLRTFPVTGNVSWGARTTKGADQLASEWKYVPVRRLALFMEESLYRGTQWAVFEPNDEPLWSQIRLNLGAFMHTLFSQGAFQGRTPRDAYFVKCDKETTTQNDIDLGRVNIIVGFAPLKPAEFVIINIQQIAGAIQS